MSVLLEQSFKPIQATDTLTQCFISQLGGVDITIAGASGLFSLFKKINGISVPVIEDERVTCNPPLLISEIIGSGVEYCINIKDVTPGDCVQVSVVDVQAIISLSPRINSAVIIDCDGNTEGVKADSLVSLVGSERPINVRVTEDCANRKSNYITKKCFQIPGEVVIVDDIFVTVDHLETNNGGSIIGPGISGYARVNEQSGALSYLYTESNITLNSGVNTISRHREAVGFDPLNNKIIGVINELTSDANGENGVYTNHYIEIVDAETGDVIEEIEVPDSLGIGSDRVTGGGYNQHTGEFYFMSSNLFSYNFEDRSFSTHAYTFGIDTASQSSDITFFPDGSAGYSDSRNGDFRDDDFPHSGGPGVAQLDWAFGGTSFGSVAYYEPWNYLIKTSNNSALFRKDLSDNSTALLFSISDPLVGSYQSRKYTDIATGLSYRMPNRDIEKIISTDICSGDACFIYQEDGEHVELSDEEISSLIRVDCGS